MYFTKMHGCGNDYVYVNCIEQQIENKNELAIRVSDRHFGIGADGLICICSSEVADFKMEMFNADGSQGAMCGNGIRCVGKFVYDYGMTKKEVVTIETLAGVKTLYLNVKNGEVASVRVCMGAPNFMSDAVPVGCDAEQCVDFALEIDGAEWRISCVSMGNPHAVTFVDSVEKLDLNHIGPKFENHSIFPNRVNTEFVEVIDSEHLKMRVWERGSGETLACGTGACACFVVAALSGKVKNRGVVHLLGGDLEIEWDRETNLVYMTGPAEIVFEGTLK